MADALQKKRERNREWMRRYRCTPEGRAASKLAQKKVYATPAGSKTRHEGRRRWKKSERGKETNRRIHLMSMYGITPNEFDAMAVSGCQICGQPDSPKKRLNVDHDHVTGKVRGVLCDHCNRGLGHFRDDQSRLFKALVYLRRT